MGPRTPSAWREADHGGGRGGSGETLPATAQMGLGQDGGADEVGSGRRWRGDEVIEGEDGGAHG